MDDRRPATTPRDRSASNGDLRWTRQSTNDIRAPLRAEAVATAHNATALRHQFHHWLVIDLSTPIVDDLVLAVSEAIANAAEHAYADHTDGPGLMQLQAHRATDHILVIVSDQGRWRTPTAARLRGRGIALMRLLTHNTHTRSDHHGTVVHLRTELAPTPPSPATNPAS